MKTLILLLLLQITTTSQAQSTFNEVFLIPKGYTGFVYVLFEQQNSTTIPIKHGNRHYNIPKDGILLTKSLPNLDYKNQTFYYVDSFHRWTKIPKQNPGTSIITSSPVITFFGSTDVYNSSDKYGDFSVSYLKIVISTNARDLEINSPQYLIDFEKKVSAKIGRRFSTLPTL